MTLTQILSEDWEAFYLNDKKITEGHSVDEWRLLKALQKSAPAGFDIKSLKMESYTITEGEGELSYFVDSLEEFKQSAELIAND